MESQYGILKRVLVCVSVLTPRAPTSLTCSIVKPSSGAAAFSFSVNTGSYRSKGPRILRCCRNSKASAACNADARLTNFCVSIRTFVLVKQVN